MQFIISKKLVDYRKSMIFMDDRVKNIIGGHDTSLVWLLEHPSLYTSGISGSQEDLITRSNIPVFYSERGGKYTYHGPGQQVVYCMVDLNKYCGQDVAEYVKILEKIIISTLSHFKINAFARYNGNIGVWIKKEDGSVDKIAAIGIKIKRWVSYHGFALNINPNLEHYEAIVPCGVKDAGITSMWSLGIKATKYEVSDIIMKNIKIFFNSVGE